MKNLPKNEVHYPSKPFMANHLLLEIRPCDNFFYWTASSGHVHITSAHDITGKVFTTAEIAREDFDKFAKSQCVSYSLKE